LRLVSAPSSVFCVKMGRPLFVVVRQGRSARPLMLESQAEAHALIRQCTPRAIRAWDRLVCAGTECHLHACAAGYILCVQSASDAAACRALALHERSVATPHGRAARESGDADWWTRSGAFADARDVFAARPAGDAARDATYEQMYILAHKFDFIEIGTCDYDTLIQSCPDDARGLSVDPMQMYLDRLPDRPRVTKVCTAVTGARSGTATLFFAHPSDIRSHNLPPWIRGCGNIGRPHPTLVRQLRKCRRSHLCRQAEVSVCSIVDLLDAHDARAVGSLRLSAGEHDCDILKGLISHCEQHPSRWPDSIRFGCGAPIDPKDASHVLHQLSYKGNYRIVSTMGDYVTVDRTGDPSFANVHYGPGGTFATLVADTQPAFLPRAPAREPVVPPNIFQFWHSPELPSHMKRIIELTKEQNPEFSYHLFNLESADAFIAANFREDVVRAFRCLVPFAYKCDLFRYCVVFVRGGIYLDIKWKCVNGFKFVHMLDGPVVLDYPHHHWFEHDHIGVWNGCLAFPPKSPILKECIDRIVENVRHQRYGFSCLYPTGPGLLGRVFEDIQPQVAFDMCLSINSRSGIIMRNNCVVMDVYLEYYAEKFHRNPLALFMDLWTKRRIYRPW
jgi:hypothetical protein